VEYGRAALIHGVGQPFELREFPVPEPEPGALVIKMRVANICGSDLHQWRGEFDLAKYGRPFPTILGHEMTGTVFRLGEGVTHDTAGQPLQVGDRVVFKYFYQCRRCRACMRGHFRACPNARAYLTRSAEHWPHFYGAFADYYYVRPDHVIFKVPDTLSDELVAGINCAFTQVVEGLTRIGVTLGDNVVIQGAGGLGVYACAVAKEMGAGQVIVVDGVAERLELALQCGADVAIDMREYTTPEARAQRVRELTEGWGADLAVEVVGHPRAFPEGVAMLGRTGRYLTIGNINPNWSVDFDPSTLILGNKTVMGIVYYEPASLKRALEFLEAHRTRYPFDRVISHRFPLAQINEAFALANENRVTRACLVP